MATDRLSYESSSHLTSLRLGSLETSQKAVSSRSQSSKKPQTPRTHSTTQKKQVLKTIYTAMTQRNSRSPLLNSASKQELKHLCEKKEREMQGLWENSRNLTPLQRAIREKLRIVNKEKDLKSQKILTQRHHEELDRKRQAKALLKQNSQLLAARTREKKTKKENLEHCLLKQSILKELETTRHHDEELFKVNLTNYFNDQLDLMKECVSQTQREMNLLKLEQKEAAATASRLRLKLLRN